MAEISTILTGVAGEYFVAAELSRRGYIASITLRNTKGIDILVSNASGSKQVGIQVKTNQKDKAEWVLNEKAENYYAENLFYVFVRLKPRDNERPDYYIVPSSIVADYVESTHKKWLKTPGKRGQKHNDSKMRKFKDTDGRYLDQWELLGLSA